MAQSSKFRDVMLSSAVAVDDADDTFAGKTIGTATVTMNPCDDDNWARSVSADSTAADTTMSFDIPVINQATSFLLKGSHKVPCKLASRDRDETGRGRACKSTSIRLMDGEEIYELCRGAKVNLMIDLGDFLRPSQSANSVAEKVLLSIGHNADLGLPGPLYSCTKTKHANPDHARSILQVLPNDRVHYHRYTGSGIVVEWSPPGSNDLDDDLGSLEVPVALHCLSSEESKGGAESGARVWRINFKVHLRGLTDVVEGSVRIRVLDVLRPRIKRRLKDDSTPADIGNVDDTNVSVDSEAFKKLANAILATDKLLSGKKECSEFLKFMSAGVTFAQVKRQEM